MIALPRNCPYSNCLPLPPQMMPYRLAFTLFVLITLGRVGLAGSPDAVVVFNEVHYNPAGTAEDGEWIELFNQMGVMTDISGWRIKGIDYVFPQGTFVGPGDYIVVAKTPSAGQLGPFTGSLDNGGERLELINRGERLMDELDYGDSGRWPVEADGSGATLAKRNPYTANQPNENWTFSRQVGGTPGAINFPNDNAPPATTTVSIFGLDTTWRYNEAGDDLGSDWASSPHPIGGNWESGQAVLASESNLEQPINTPLDFPGLNFPYRVTYYFEKEFELGAGQVGALQSLPLRHLIDDGAVFYLNGVEVLRTNLPGGVISAATRATDNIEATLSDPIPLPPGAAVAGTNRLSVEVHQTSGISSDIVFGAALDIVLEDAAPGTAPPIAINELPPAAEPNFWIELINTGGAAVDIGGMAVSVGSDPEREYLIPAQSLAGGGILLLDEATLGFRPAEGENLFLYDATKSLVLDGQVQTGRLRGRSSWKDGAWLYPDGATPGSPNQFSFHDEIVISEIAYNPPALSAIPATPATFESVEVLGFNAVWRYNDSDPDLPAGWANTSHPIGGGWKSAGAPIGVENSPLDEPLVTVISPYNASTITYYFEREFDISAQQIASADSIEITHQIDDGAIFYINGIDVGGFNLASGAGSETPASPSVGNASIQSLAIPADALVVGSNRLSVEVHQSGAGSSDVVFGLRLALRTVLTPAIPGAPFRDSDNQWIEVANRSGTPVDLSGWEFGDGISFEFPAGTSLAPGEHACIARSAEEFAAAFPGARLLGEFGGSLSRTGERLLLRDANHNPVDELRYFDSGRWPEAPDGGGSTLELRDLDADNNTAESWAPSDESAKSSWKTYSYRGVAAGDGGPTRWQEFNIGLLDSGVILIDDISVIEDPDGAAVPMLTNSDFESGSTGWRLRGNHRHSEIVADPDNPGNQVLRLVATSATEHMHNQIETTLAGGRSVTNGRTYEISFRARWESGSPQFLTRLYFTRVARANTIDRPPNPGTPSAPNSTAEPNIGPALNSLLHSPAVPDAGEPITVTAAASDPDGVVSLALNYAVNGGGFQSTPMVAGAAGRYQGTVPGQAAAAVVQFYIVASDGLGATSMSPAGGPDSRALIKVDDGLAATNGLHNFRVILTNADRDFMYTDTEVMSNDRLGATIIDRESEIYYDARVRLKGSERARAYQPRVGYNLRFGADQPYRGIHQSMAIDRSEGTGSGQFEYLFDIMIANSGGVISRYYDLIQVITPTGTTHTRPAVLQMARYDDVFLDSQFEQGSDGMLFEYDFVYYPQSTDNAGNKLPQGDGISGLTIRDNGDDKERYRFYLLKKNNRDADDYGPIIRYAKHMSKSGAAFDDGIDEVIDVDGWLRGMAYAVLSGAGDNVAAGDGHNGMYYAHPDGRVMFLPHDMDFAFSNTRSVFANAECARIANSNSNPGNAQRKRIYFGHLHDIIETTWNDTYMGIWKSHLSQLSPTQNWNGPNSGSVSPGARGANVMSQITGAIPEVAYGITSSDPLIVDGSTATIAGDGWVNVRKIRLAGGGELDVTWTDDNSWRVEIPVVPGANSITLEAVNFSGEVIGSDTVTVNNTSTIAPAAAANLVISEVMYHPAPPSAAEIAAGFSDADLFEFVELMNIGPLDVSLDGAEFSSRINDRLPAVTITPGSHVVLARDRAALLSRYPGLGAALLPGGYGAGDSNQLSNGGEQIALVDAAGNDIRRFTYGDNTPWPSAADGTGYSLVLIAPATSPDHALPGSWRSSSLPGGNPGAADSVAFVGDPDADDNSNGVSNFLEHALGANPPPLEVRADPDISGGLRFSFQRNLSADDVVIEVQSSEDLSSWSTTLTTLVSSVNQGDGTAIETWAAAPPTPGGRRLFARLIAVSR